MAKAKEYEFPLLNDTEIVTELSEILPPQSATELSINDLKKPTASKWQKFYIDILCMVFELQVGWTQGYAEVFRSFPLKKKKSYSCNENTMRGAAKSLATPPTAFTMNVIEMIEVVDASISQFNSRHHSDFWFSF